MTELIHDVVVVGGGPAGLSAAYALKQQKLNPFVIEQTQAVGDVWRNHYEGLRLNTKRYFSRLAGGVIPRSAGAWPGKDDVVRMLESIPRNGGFQVETGVCVTAVVYEPDTSLWRIQSDSLADIFARVVVLAVGASRLPVIPEWPGLDSFTGEVLHSSKFKNALDHKGKRVLVVGSGNSGAEIATRLSEHADVTLSIRTPPYILPKSVCGVPLASLGVVLRKLPRAVGDCVLAFLQRQFVGDLTKYGLPLPKGSLSEKFSRTHVTPTLYAPFATALRSGRLKIVGPIQKINHENVYVQDRIFGESDELMDLKPDLIVAATGFRPGLADLVSAPNVKLPEDWPRSHIVEGPAVLPNLHVIGQVNPLSGQLREIRLESYRIAKLVQRELKMRHQTDTKAVRPSYVERSV
ncbi:flavin-containing monooxygenase [Advenella sp. RU8]|uniref:flavin-containing monooxygenase n=1 Tax=Advenella sp. RU8 TaxID=3399575 RepID=UPI003AABBCEA